MQAFVLAAMSFLLTSSVIGNAYYQKKQFYPSVVYITKSNPSMAVLYIQAFVFVVLMGKLMRKIFFGQLRAAEMEHLIERSWYAVTETCLAFTVFRDDFSPRFVGMFTLLLFLKCFHWLAEDRVDFMERSPIITILFHLRVLCLLLVLAAVDLHFINLAYYSTILKGASVQLVFGFEYAILLTVVLMTLTKYILHTIDVQSENPWENKAVYLLYTELIMGLIKVLLYALFVVIMIKVHTFPLFAIRPMYLSVRAFKKALHDVIMSRRAIRNMNTLYPDATSEELMSGDNVCIICREEMITACKKLPCNHIFHASCLRSWFQRQQTCPTCRMDVLRVHRPQQSQQQQQQSQQQQQQPQQQQQQVPPAQPPHFSPNMMLPGFHPMWPFPPPPPPPTSTSATNVTTPEMRAASSTATAEGASAASFMPFSPFCMPYGFPSPPPVLSSVPAEELKILEGHERSNVEARVQWLKDIQSLLDGAMLLINQYNLVAAQMGLQGISAIAQQNTSAASTPEKSSKNTSCEKKSSEDSEVKSGLNSSQLPQTEVLDLMGLEGATGYTPPAQEITPVWEDSHEEMHENELHEVRRRRIQHFSKEQKSTNSKVEDNLELD